MIKTITIDDKEVRLKSSAALPRLYNQWMGKDFFADMQTMSDKNLEPIENMAYVMARYADPDNVPANIIEWLEQFDTLSLYQHSAEIVELLQIEQKTTVSPKKKVGR